MTTPNLSTARAALKNLSQELAGKYLERDAVAQSMVLALIAGENVLLLGPPGTAKSAITNDFAGALGYRTFTKLMGRTTTPDEVFGPIRLSALRDDRMERQIDGYLPTAEVAFLDEVFKANSAVLNSLLTALNENQFDQGSARIDIPLQITIGASNELPQEDGLDAIYDRFMVRHDVQPLVSDTNFQAMLNAGEAVITDVLEGALETVREAAAQVGVTKVVPVMAKLRNNLATKHGIVASDRRWRKSLGLVRASAALSGRSEAVAADLTILAHVLWSRPEEHPMIRDEVMQLRSPEMTALIQLRKDATEAVKDLGDLGAMTLDNAPELGRAKTKLGQILTEAQQALSSAAPEEQEDAQEVVEDIEGKVDDLKRVLSALYGGLTL